MPHGPEPSPRRPLFSLPTRFLLISGKLCPVAVRGQENLRENTTVLLNAHLLPTPSHTRAQCSWTGQTDTGQTGPRLISAPKKDQDASTWPNTKRIPAD